MVESGKVQRMLFKLFVFLTLFTFSGPVILFADADKIFRENHKAVVVITAYDERHTPISQGSGFVARQDGVIVTNHHVIADAQYVAVKIGSRKLEVNGVLHVDKHSDIAILKLQAKGLPVVKIANSEKAKVGDKIYVISSPQGLENTLSDGILSGIRRIDEDRRVLQITAPISPGSSGGPVFNPAGEVIGIATFLLKGSQNLNFALPAELLKDGLGSRQVRSLRSKYSQGPGSYWFITHDESERDEEGTDEEEYLFVLDFISAMVLMDDANLSVMSLTAKSTGARIIAIVSYRERKMAEALRTFEKWKGSRNIKIRKVSEVLSNKLKDLASIKRDQEKTNADCFVASNNNDSSMLSVCELLYDATFTKNKDKPGIFTQLIKDINKLLFELPTIVVGSSNWSKPMRFPFPKHRLLRIAEYVQGYIDKEKTGDFHVQFAFILTSKMICNYLKRGVDTFEVDDAWNECSLTEQ